MTAFLEYLASFWLLTGMQVWTCIRSAVHASLLALVLSSAQVEARSAKQGGGEGGPIQVPSCHRGQAHAARPEEAHFVPGEEPRGVGPNSELRRLRLSL